ncbi:uncharacterized protein LOC126553856, partial [Aphis gossypii]|uniref:uncharacterized protein LOC126553856 n=1 Tax=Aphis gossypii TaxID=80765 RepID=UPI002158E5C1
FDDIEVTYIIYVLYEEHEVSKKQKRDKIKRRLRVYPLNLKRPMFTISQNGQFQVTFMTLRSYPEEFIKYYRMSIRSFDELLSLVSQKFSKQHTGLRMPIPPEERLTVTMR